MSGMGIRLPHRPRWLHLPRPPYFTDETRPQNFDELVDSHEAQRVAGWWRGVGVVVLLIVMPAAVLLAATLGQRDREHNCRVTEQALVGENLGITNAFAAAFIDPGDSRAEVEEVLAKAAIARQTLDTNTLKIMEGCNG